MAEGQGRSSEQGVKLLYIRDYLHKYTNKEHPKSAKDIIEYLASKGIKAERKTIYNDILRLQMDFQEPIEYNPKKWGYYITEPQFEAHELRLLIDSLQANRYATKEEVQEISAKLRELANVYDQKELADLKQVNTGILRRTTSVAAKLDIIQEAIEANRKISFRLAYRIPDRTYKTKLAYNEFDKTDVFTVNPHSVLCENGKYYLYTYGNEIHPAGKFPIHLFQDIKILPVLRDKMEQSKSPLKVEAERTNAPKKVMSVFFPNVCAPEVIKYLGEDIMMIPEDNGFRVDIKYRNPVEMQKLFGWIAGQMVYPDCPRILAPDYAVFSMALFARSVHREFGLKEADEQCAPLELKSLDSVK